MVSSTPDLCTEEEVSELVHAFYAKVHEDPLLAPIFNAHVKDWEQHLAKMVDFWSSTLRGTARYRGTPMPRHAQLPGLDPELFKRWLSLFHQTTRALGNAAMRDRADMLAPRIAESLWYGYQMYNNPSSLPRDLDPR
ncbi:Group 3 truncated hemoglobin ctb [Pararobbsia alpina]|uniref:Group 3 truncated hemoglobin ctb n=1 Tax=Pararobbsia alpina TaxID=621374 RepID=A0A6S7CQ84_9BURK|nr:Group 3 truncated hemoglobin ctb [Pararobbsia alpina]